MSAAIATTIGAATAVSAGVAATGNAGRRPKTALIIGAGHNGLTCAFYLAKAGMKVRLFEKRHVVGGCAVTEEIDPLNAPGNRVSTASYMASMLLEVIATWN
jgi:phytoene dehydrogenase-like protein